MTPKIYISLVLEDELVDTNLLTLLQELGTTAIWQKGELKNNTALTHLNNGCSFSRSPITGFSVEGVIESFLQFLETEKPKVLEVIQAYQLNPTLSLTIYINDIMPSVHLTHQLLERLSKMKAELDLDLILTNE